LKNLLGLSIVAPVVRQFVKVSPLVTLLLRVSKQHVSIAAKLTGVTMKPQANVVTSNQVDIAKAQARARVKHLDLAAYMRTASEVGGDYYDFHLGEDGMLTIAVGDATGHGLKAGTMVSVVKGLFVSLSYHPDIPTFRTSSRG
jgi:hypothetical protein